MTTQRLESIEKVLKVMTMTETKGGDYKDHLAEFSSAMPESKDLQGLTKEEISKLDCGSDCPRAFEDLISDLEDEFEKAGFVVVFTEKELRILELQKEIKALSK